MIEKVEKAINDALADILATHDGQLAAAAVLFQRALTICDVAAGPENTAKILQKALSERQVN